VVQKRVAFFIDGFNLYHAIDDLQDNRLKWLNLKSLAESYLRAGDTLVSVAYFTAFNVWDKAKRQRHVAYANALQHLGVETILGGFLKTPKWCRKLNRSCNYHSEKKTDVGIAVRLIADAFEDKFDLAFLLTADSDHVPMVQRFRASLPHKKLLLITPPKRYKAARELIAAVGANHASKLSEGRIRQHLLPHSMYDARSKLVTTMPAAYIQP
jgi:NYN domain